MTLSQFNLLFALLALVALTAGIGLILAAPVIRRSPSARQALARLAVPLAWVVAAASMAGSLYYSEVAGFTPCTLCWYQRIAMYPLVLVLAVAAVRGDRRTARWSGAPLALVGWGIAAYHYTLQTFPSLSGAACSPTAPCSFRWVSEFGFVSIPFMALSGFTAIAALLIFGAEES